MRFSVWVSSGYLWSEILALCHHIEATGWDGIWVPDHFMPPEHGYSNEPVPGHDPELDPVHEGWSLIAALAGLVPRVRLGVLVSGNTYRHPAVLAKMAATIDHISGGRHILGLGAGWQENEHRRYGIPLPTPAVLSDRLEEAAAVISSLFSAESRASFDGSYYQIDDAPLRPRPIQDPMPLLIGGTGELRTIRTAARYASHWNAWGLPDPLARKRIVLERHCAEGDRDPNEVAVSANAFVMVLDSAGEAADAREAMGEKGGLIGTTDQIKQRIAEYAEAGVDELVIPTFNFTPDALPAALDQLREIVGSD